MRISIFLILAFATLGGCATASKTYTADGKEGYNIACSGSALNWGMCYEKAGNICGTKGYVVLGVIGVKSLSLNSLHNEHKKR